MGDRSTAGSTRQTRGLIRRVIPLPPPFDVIRGGAPYEWEDFDLAKGIHIGRHLYQLSTQ
jgi:hypothetical protein